MSKDTIKGAAQTTVGSVEGAAGKATGNEKLRAEGKAVKVAGTAKEGVGKTKDAVHGATK